MNREIAHDGPGAQASQLAQRTRAAVEQARTDKQRAESETRYRSLFESMDEGYCIIKVLFDDADQPFDWRFVEVNAAFESHSGLADAAGKTMRDLVPDLAPDWYTIYGRIVRTGESERFERLSYTLDRWWSIYAFPIGEPGPGHVAVIFSDITCRKQTETTNAARLSAIVESSDDAIISKDLNGVMQTWNAGAQRLFGYTAAETVGQPVTMLMPPEQVHEERDILSRIGRGEHIAHYETVRRHKNGTSLDVSLSISPIVDAAGKIVGASKIARDISERRRTERWREQQTDLLKLIASGASLEQCLSVLCRALSRSSSGVRVSILLADAAGTSLRQPIAPELQPAWREGLTDALRNESMHGSCDAAIARGEPIISRDAAHDERWSREWRQLCVANDIQATYSVPVWDEDAEVVAALMLGFAQSREPNASERTLAEFGSRVTSIALARNRANEALRTADRRKDEFMATLAHELRNPLVPLRNGMELLRQNDPATTEKARTMMTRQLTQLTYLVNDLIDVSRMTRGTVQLRLTDTDLAAVLRDAVDSTRYQIDAAGHTLRLALPTEPLRMRADPKRLTQALINLICNAINYTPGHGHIELVLERTENAAVMVVRDNGMGIAADRLPDIFDLFIQGDPPAGQANEGLGIGLTLAKQVIELHGGVIEARSAGAGQGAEFTLRLPLSEEQPSMAASSQPAARQPGTLRLLVVDDQPDVADSLALLLETYGHEVCIAHDGYQALDATRAFQPDAVFLDIGLPGIDGFETAKRMRATPAGRDVLLIAQTGWGQAQDRERSTAAGFDHHLVKPVEPDTIERLLTEHRP